MSIVNALKRLVVALGGASDPMDVPGENISAVVDQITKALPDNPTPSPSGDSVFRISVIDGATSGKYVADKTFEEITAAIEAGKVLVCDLDLTLTQGAVHFTMGFYSRNYTTVDDTTVLSSLVFSGGTWTTVEQNKIPFMIMVLIDGQSMAVDGVAVDSLQLQPAIEEQ